MSWSLRAWAVRDLWLRHRLYPKGRNWTRTNQAFREFRRFGGLIPIASRAGTWVATLDLILRHRAAARKARR